MMIPFRERISCTIAEASEATGISRSKLYQEINAGRLETRKVGARVLVLVESLKSLVGSNSARVATQEIDPPQLMAG